MYGPADDTRQNIERHFDNVEAIDPEYPEQVGKPTLQSIEEDCAYRDAEYSADSKLEKFNEVRNIVNYPVTATIEVASSHARFSLVVRVGALVERSARLQGRILRLGHRA